MAAALPSDAPRRLADARTVFFGLGAQRCGSTWLHRLLDSHPDIHVPNQQKELHYWTRLSEGQEPIGLQILARQKPTGIPPHPLRSVLTAGGRAERQRVLERGAFLKLWEECLTNTSNDLGAYERVLLFGAGEESVVGEITPAYALLEAQVFARMAQVNARTKFIYVMRDPVDRLLSAVSYLNAAEAEVTGPDLLDSRLQDVLDDPRHPLLRRSRYEETIAQLEQAVPGEDVFYAFFEEMRTQGEVDRLWDFLGVTRIPAIADTQVNASRQAKHVFPPILVERAYEMLQPTYRACRDRFDRLPARWRSETEGSRTA